MGTPTRYPNGVTNVRATSPTGKLTEPDQSQIHTYFNDFDTYAAGDWTVTAVGTSTAALTNGDGGILLLTTGATSSNSESLQKVGESFSFELGKPMWFKARFKVSTLATVMVAGLQVTDTTPEDVTDGIYFLSADATGVVTIYCRKNATTGSTSAVAGQLVADTYTEFAWYWDGKDNVTFWQDGVAKGTLTSVAANYLPDTTTTPSFAVRTTSANARTMSLDYIYAAKQRVNGA